MTWDDHYQGWITSRQAHKLAEANERLKQARKQVSHNTSEDWQWLQAALDDPEKKWFVAEAFRFQSVPKRLLPIMLRAAVYERDVSLNREFIEPCVRSYGVVRIFENLLCYLQEGTDYEKSGAVSAFYWVAGTGNRDAAPFIREFYCLILAEFVNNKNVDVRQRILPFLGETPMSYPKELRQLAERSIQIATKHGEEIRHRIEVPFE